MGHDIVVLKARIRVLESENYFLKQQSRDKLEEIRFLKKELRRMELKIPRKVSEFQLSFDDFV